MRYLATVISLASAALVAACGGSNNEPPKEPASEVVSPSMAAPAPTTPPPDGMATTTPGMTEPPSGSSTPGTTGTTTATSQGQNTATDMSMRNTRLSDAEIIGIESALNKGEIELAELAVKNAKTAQVRNFATMMINQHKAAETKMKKVAQSASLLPSDTDTSTQLKTEVQSTAQTLKTQKGADFDKAYMDSQVKMHKDALNTIDNKLVPSATNSELKDHLTDVRKHIVLHLTHAEHIADNLATNSAALKPKK
ncbi:MAG: DUF4142 domain-containing protein [Polyangiaceae bacterium]|nr:DUF4142 domain-containing protein [Polyangiaceae bacterium]